MKEGGGLCDVSRFKPCHQLRERYKTTAEAFSGAICESNWKLKNVKLLPETLTCNDYNENRKRSPVKRLYVRQIKIKRFIMHS